MRTRNQIRSLNKPDHLILTTVQSVDAYSILMREGILFGNADLGSMKNSDERSKIAYSWLKEQMQIRVAKPDYALDLLWAWYRFNFNDAPLDLRGSRGEAFDCWRLDLLVPKNEILLSDFDYWHCVLGGWPITNSNVEDEDMSHSEIRQTWEEIFNFSPSQCSTQATLWHIKKSWIVRKRFHKARKLNS